MTRAHKTRIYPNDKQATLLSKTMGCSRSMYNWALNEVKRDNPEVEEGQEKPPFVYDRYGLQKKMTAHKNTIPYMKRVTSYAIVNSPSDNLDDGLKRCKVGLNKFPRFHSKSHGGSFRLDGSLIKYDKNTWRLKLPTPRAGKEIGWIRMGESIRFDFTKINNITISRKANTWFCSFNCEVAGIKPLCSDITKEVGIDLGIGKSNLMVCSDGTVIPNHSLWKRDEDAKRVRDKSRSRKWVKGKKNSKNWWKANKIAQKQENRITCIRADYNHKITTAICKKYGTICLEDLDVKGMLSANKEKGNKKINRSQSSAAFGEIRRQLTYKASQIKVIPTYDPSTNRCSECGTKKVGEEKIGLSERTFSCNSCGHTEDRDLNAAKCILKYAVAPEDKVKKIGKRHIPKKLKTEVMAA